MGTWKKLITASDGVEALSNVSDGTPATNQVLKFDGSFWVPGTEGVDVNVYLDAITYGTSITANGNNTGITNCQVLETTDSYLENGASDTVNYRRLRIGEFFEDFAYRLLLANIDSDDDYAGTTIKTRFGSDGFVDVGGAFGENQTLNGGYQLIYAKDSANIDYPVDPSTESEATFQVEFTGQIGNIDPYVLTASIKFVNEPVWGLSTDTLLTEINDTQHRGWFDGELESMNGVWQTTMDVSAYSYKHFETSSSGWRTFTLTEASQYLWWAVPTRMNAAGLTLENYDANATYKPTLFYRKDINDGGSQAPGNFIGKRTAVKNESGVAGFPEDFYYWNFGTFNDSYNSAGTVQFKITWEAA